MAMTKRFKVAFEATVKFSTKEETQFFEGLETILEKRQKGLPVDPQMAAIAERYQKLGREEALELALAEGFKRLIKDAHAEMCSEERKAVRFGPVTAEVLQ